MRALYHLFCPLNWALKPTPTRRSQPIEGEITRLHAELTVKKASIMARPVQTPSCHASARGKTPHGQIARLDYFVAVGVGRVIVGANARATAHRRWTLRPERRLR